MGPGGSLAITALWDSQASAVPLSLVVNQEHLISLLLLLSPSANLLPPTSRSAEPAAFTTYSRACASFLGRSQKYLQDALFGDFRAYGFRGRRSSEQGSIALHT